MHPDDGISQSVARRVGDGKAYLRRYWWAFLPQAILFAMVLGVAVLHLLRIPSLPLESVFIQSFFPGMALAAYLELRATRRVPEPSDLPASIAAEV